jgi:ubiquitin C-terminal hydrolase
MRTARKQYRYAHQDLNWYCSPHVQKFGDSDGVYCSRCKEFKPATKELRLWSVPPILIIHLNRFEFDQKTVCES